jgi:hypothetical protein
VAVYWNVPVSVVAEGAAQLWWRSEASWPLAGFLALSFAVGLGWLALAAIATVEEWPGLRGLRPPTLELSEHPLAHGDSVELTMSLPGPAHFRSFRLVLRCEVRTAMRDAAGEAYTKIESVHEDELLREENLRVGPETPFTTRCQLCLPPDALPSTAGEPARVCWRVEAAGRRAGWHLGFRFEYPVTVVDRPAENQTPSTSFIVYRPAGLFARNFAASSAPRA